MKDAFEVLYQKEVELARVRHEIESLAVVAPLLDDMGPGDSGWDSDDQYKKPAENVISPSSDSKATGTDGLRSTVRRPGFWDALKRKR